MNRLLIIIFGLCVNYKNNVFEIDQYYPKSKHPNVTYHE
jgi:hypothetical protein